MSQAPSLTVRTVNLDCDDAQEMARFYGGLRDAARDELDARPRRHSATNASRAAVLGGGAEGI